MRQWMARGERIAREAVRARAELIAAEIAEQPGIAAQAAGDRVLMSGRGLARRWLGDPALRFIGRTSR